MVAWASSVNQVRNACNRVLSDCIAMRSAVFELPPELAWISEIPIISSYVVIRGSLDFADIVGLDSDGCHSGVMFVLSLLLF